MHEGRKKTSKTRGFFRLLRVTTSVYSMVCIVSLTGLEHKHTHNLACFRCIRTCNGVIRIAILQTY